LIDVEIVGLVRRDHGEGSGREDDGADQRNAVPRSRGTLVKVTLEL